MTIWNFVGKVMSLLFNMLSRFVIAFLPRNKCLLISWLQFPSVVILEPRKIKSLTISIFFPHLFAMKWWDWMPWSLVFECWVLSQLFQLSSFTFIKRLFSSSLLSAIRVVSSVYLDDTTHVAESRIIGAQYILAEWILKIITPHALVLPTDYLNYCIYNSRQSPKSYYTKCIELAIGILIIIFVEFNDLQKNMVVWNKFFEEVSGVNTDWVHRVRCFYDFNYAVS